MRITGAPGNALSATRPASGLVAFESLYQRTPAHSPTSSSRCSTPRTERMASLIASSARPAMRTRREVTRDRIATIEHRIIRVHDRARLQIDVALESPVTIEVVGRDVED